ncbi:hypothetical protein [Streptomyces sp. bgisy031]|uniref:hypothetical protein n=1 Tax=Streptomyces sp. bgisy031 TaxID=3413772 RepID=UPI003D7073B6
MTSQAGRGSQTDTAQIPPPRAGAHLRTGTIDLSESRLWHDRLGSDLHSLRIEDPVPLRVRVALRRRAHLTTWNRNLLKGALWVVLFSAVMAFSNALVWLAGARDDDTIGDDQNPLIHREQLPLGLFKPPFLAYVHDLPVAISHTVMVALGAALAFGVAWAIIVYLAAYVLRHGRPSVLTWFLLARRYALVMQCADAVHACAAARGSGGERQARMLRRVSKRLRAVLRNVPDAPSARRSVPRLSARKRALKAHARRVAAALRAIEQRIDTEPDEALRELACALVQVSDRYCHARLGVLLDDHYLQDIEQPPNRELLRWVVALLVAGGSVTGLAVSGMLPEPVEGIVYTIAILLSLTIAFGRKIQRSIEVLAAITGGA